MSVCGHDLIVCHCLINTFQKHFSGGKDFLQVFTVSSKEYQKEKHLQQEETGTITERSYWFYNIETHNCVPYFYAYAFFEIVCVVNYFT